MSGPAPPERVLGQGPRRVLGAHSQAGHGPASPMDPEAPEVRGRSIGAWRVHRICIADRYAVSTGRHHACPRRPVSLEIGHQIQNQISSSPTPLPQASWSCPSARQISAPTSHSRTPGRCPKTPRAKGWHSTMHPGGALAQAVHT